MQKKSSSKKWIAMFILITMLFTLMPGTALADVVTENVPEAGAASYIVVEASTGEVLFGKNYQQQCAPAGTVQIMTALLAIESGKLDSEVTVPELPDYNASGAVTVHLGKGERQHETHRYARS